MSKDQTVFYWVKPWCYKLGIGALRGQLHSVRATVSIHIMYIPVPIPRNTTTQYYKKILMIYGIKLTIATSLLIYQICHPNSNTRSPGHPLHNIFRAMHTWKQAAIVAAFCTNHCSVRDLFVMAQLPWLSFAQSCSQPRTITNTASRMQEAKAETHACTVK